MSLDYLVAQEVIDRCQAAGIVLTATAGALGFDSPPGALAEFVDDLRAHKPAILELLQTDWTAWAMQGTVSPDAPLAESPAAAKLRRRAAELRVRRGRL